VLHPEVYFEDFQMTPPVLPKLRKRKQYKELAAGTVGEFDFAVLLSQYDSKEAVREIAPGWRAGHYIFLEHKRDKHTILMHASEWVDAKTAGEFAAGYRKALEGKWESLEVTREDGSEVWGTGDDGRFVIRLSGPLVYVAEGLRNEEQIRAWPQP
jgi:hypothetical protein